MRSALAGLTVRGRAFVAAGLSAILCALVLGQPALVRVGVLVIVLPLVSAVVVGRSRYRFSLMRTVSPQLVEAGQSARVELQLVNEGRAPNGVLLLEEHLPYVLGNRPRFVLEGIGHGWRRHVSYQVRSDVRGRFEIGPMTIRVNDPFGLVELGRSFRTTVPLVVTPRTVALPMIPLSGALAGSGDNRPRAFASGSAEDVTVREYRQGDDLRRVHWRSSARTGELMVRREEQPWHQRATLFIDTRTIAHQGRGIASSLESAVAAAASIAVHLTGRGYAVRLVTARGEDPTTVWHDRSAGMNTGPILEALAVLEPARQPQIDTGWVAESGRTGLTIAILGSVVEQDQPALRRMRQHASTAVALVLDVPRWAGLSPRDVVDLTAPVEPGSGPDPRPVGRRPEPTEGVVREAAWLRRQGWRAVTLSPRDRLPAVWQDLGRGMSGGAFSSSSGRTTGPGAAAVAAATAATAATAGQKAVG